MTAWPANSVAVAGRNAATARHPFYWWVLCSGLFEPLLYLLSVGVGVGALFGDLRPAGGNTTAYAAFVAPAMLAALAMQGALAETFNVFIKMKYMRLYDATLATPVTPAEIAFGELLWAMLRSAAYTVVFLAIMVWMDLTAAVWALAVLPVSVAVGFVFGAVGMMLATFVRDSSDLDYALAAQAALFMFSGTFVPVDTYPVVLRVIVELTPLYHAVELLRALASGTLDPFLPWHLGYLVMLTVVGMTVAVRRMKAALCP